MNLEEESINSFYVKTMGEGSDLIDSCSKMKNELENGKLPVFGGGVYSAENIPIDEDIF